MDRNRPDVDGTTRLSPYLHFGWVSPLTVVQRLRGTDDEVVRQLAWRDFHHQVAAAFPKLVKAHLRRGQR